MVGESSGVRLLDSSLFYSVVSVSRSVQPLAITTSEKRDCPLSTTDCLKTVLLLSYPRQYTVLKTVSTRHFGKLKTGLEILRLKTRSLKTGRLNTVLRQA